MLTWTFYELSKPENISVLRTLQAEIDREIGPYGPESKENLPDNVEQLARCTYMDAVCSESMRCHTVIPGIGRAAAQPVTIAGRRFPTGLLQPCQHSASRRPSAISCHHASKSSNLSVQWL